MVIKTHLIRFVTNNLDNHDVKYLKTKFNLNDDLSLNKTLKTYNIVYLLDLFFMKARNITGKGNRLNFLDFYLYKS